MNEFKTSEALQVFDMMRAEGSKALRIKILEEHIDVYSVRLCLYIIVSGAITKRPKVVFNRFESEDDFEDIKKAFHGDISQIPMTTTRLLVKLYYPNQGLGITRGDIIGILEGSEPIDVYALLGGVTKVSQCEACGTSIDSEGLCDYCIDAFGRFTEFRVDDLFTASLSKSNYKRHGTLNPGGLYTFTHNSYRITYIDSSLICTRIGTIWDARLPFTEYQQTLS